MIGAIVQVIKDDPMIPLLRINTILIPIMLVRIILVSPGGRDPFFVGLILGFVVVIVRCEALSVTEWRRGANFAKVVGAHEEKIGLVLTA